MKYSFLFLFSVASCAVEYDFSQLPSYKEGGYTERQVLNNEIPEGVYSVVVGLNGNKIDEYNVTFLKYDVNDVAKPCVDAYFLIGLGVNAQHSDIKYNKRGCVENSNGLINIFYDDMKAEVNVIATPSIIMGEYDKMIASLDVDSIDAVRFNYVASNHISKSKNTGSEQHSKRVYISSMANFDAWRAFADSTLQESPSGIKNIKFGDAYIYRPMIDNKSILSIGSVVANQRLFDFRRLIGVEYRVEPGLLSSFESSFVPTIPIILAKNAVVRLYQERKVIYESYYLAGSYNISDYVADNRIPIDVEIETDDRDMTSFTVPYRGPSNMTRVGSSVNYFSAGRHDDSDTNFLMFVNTRGLTDWMSTSHGIDLSKKNPKIAGAGDFIFNSNSGGTLKAEVSSERSYSELSLYSGFFDGEANLGVNYRIFFNSKNTEGAERAILINAQRYLFDGAISFSAGLQYGKDSAGVSRSAQGLISMSGMLSDVSYMVYYNGNIAKSVGEGAKTHQDNLIGVSFSIPFDFNSFGRTQITSLFDKNGGSTTLSHSAQYDDFDVSAAISKNTNQKGTTKTIGGNYHAGVASLQGYYSAYPLGDSLRFEARGGALLSEKGIKLSENIPETVMLVNTSGVEGVRFINEPYERSNSDGIAALGVKAPYSMNRVTIINDSIPDDVEAKILSVSGVATRGAVLYREIPLLKGTPLIVKISNGSELKIPFGAKVSAAKYDLETMVDRDGYIFIPSLPLDVKAVSVAWNGGSCEIDLNDVGLVDNDEIKEFIAKCHTPN